MSIDAWFRAPILWPLDAKSQLLEKTLALGKIDGQKEKVEAEDEGWLYCNTKSMDIVDRSPGDTDEGRAWHAGTMGSQRVDNLAIEQQQLFSSNCV